MRDAPLGLSLCLAAAALAIAEAPVARANGLLVTSGDGAASASVSRPAVTLEKHRVTATIRGGVADVDVEQVFRNRSAAQLEGVYLFPLPEGATVARFAMTMFSLAFYVSRTLVPIGLSPLYELPATVDPLAREFVLSTVGTVGLTAAAIGWRRRAPWFTAAWSAYVVMVLPISGPVHAGFQLAHDRYSYLSCLPWALLAGAGAGALIDAWRRRAVSARVCAAAAAAVLVTIAGWSYLTAQQVRVWRDSETLWSAAVDVAPACAICRSNLGSAWLKAGRLDAASRELQAAIALRPERAAPHNTLGAVLYRQRRYAESAGEFDLAVRLKPGFAEPINNLGVLYAHLGKIDEAARHFEAALKLQPDYVEARENLIRVMAHVRDS